MPRWIALIAALALVSATPGCGANRSYTVDESGYRSAPQGSSAGSAPPAMVALERQASAERSVNRAGSSPSWASSEAAPVPTSDAESEPRRRAPRPAPVAKGSKRGSDGRGDRAKHQQRPDNRDSQVAASGKDQDHAQQVETKVANDQPADEEHKPLVVYLGYLKLRVKRVLEVVDAITKRTDEAKGYIQSLGSRVIIVRIPASDFEAVMASFAEFGEVVDRRVKAVDVTNQYTDVHARLAVSRESLNRLLALLHTVKDVNERLRIVQEIKRLGEQIETMESTLATLKNLVDYFTITIEIEPVVADHNSLEHRSPFPWVRSLMAHLTTVEAGRDRVTLTLPKGYVLFHQDDVWRARAADTSVLRIGRVENEPRGDAPFWARAVEHELDGRDEDRVLSGQAGALEWRVYRNKDIRPRYWLVGLRTVGADAFVVEAFFPNEQSWTAHGKAVIASLDSLEVR